MQSYYPKTGYPFYYPTGTRVQKYPKVRALVLSADAIVDLLLLLFDNCYDLLSSLSTDTCQSNTCLSLVSLVRQWLAPLLIEKHLKPSVSSNMDEDRNLKDAALSHSAGAAMDRSSKSGIRAAWNQRALPSGAEVF